MGQRAAKASKHHALLSQRAHQISTHIFPPRRKHNPKPVDLRAACNPDPDLSVQHTRFEMSMAESIARAKENCQTYLCFETRDFASQSELPFTLGPSNTVVARLARASYTAALSSAMCDVLLLIE